MLDLKDKSPKCDPSGWGKKRFCNLNTSTISMLEPRGGGPEFDGSFRACSREKHSSVSIMNLGNVAQTNISFRYPLDDGLAAAK